MGSRDGTSGSCRSHKTRVLELLRLHGAVDDELVGAEFAQPHWAAGVEAVRGDSDFRAEAEFEAVSKAGAGVPVGGGGVYA